MVKRSYIVHMAAALWGLAEAYAVLAPLGEVSLATFIILSAFARFARFAAVTAFCHIALRGLRNTRAHEHRLAILLGGWSLFYVFYFYVYL